MKRKLSNQIFWIELIINMKQRIIMNFFDKISNFIFDSKVLNTVQKPGKKMQSSLAHIWQKIVTILGLIILWKNFKLRIRCYLIDLLHFFKLYFFPSPKPELIGSINYWNRRFIILYLFNLFVLVVLRIKIQYIICDFNRKYSS